MKNLLTNCASLAIKCVLVMLNVMIIIPLRFVFGDEIDRQLKAGAVCRKKGHILEYGDHGKCIRGCGWGLLRINQ